MSNNVDLTNLLNQVEQFLEILGITRCLGIIHWNERDLEQAQAWATYVESSITMVDKNGFSEELDKRLVEKFGLNDFFRENSPRKVLDNATQLLHRCIIQSPYLKEHPQFRDVFASVFSYYFQGNSKERRRRRQEDIIDFIKIKATSSLLHEINDLIMHCSKEPTIVSVGNSKIKVPSVFKYDLSSTTSSKMAYARKMQEKFVLLQDQMDERQRILLMIVGEAMKDVDCLEIVCLLALLQWIEKQRYIQDEIILGILKIIEDDPTMKIWTLSPWLLARLCDLSFAIAKQYIPHLAFQAAVLPNSRFQEGDWRTRMACVFQQSTQLQQFASRYLEELKLL